MSDDGDPGRGAVVRGHGRVQGSHCSLPDCAHREAEEPAGDAPAATLVADGVEEPSQEVRALFGAAYAGAEHFAHMLAQEGDEE